MPDLALLRDPAQHRHPLRLLIRLLHLRKLMLRCREYPTLGSISQAIEMLLWDVDNPQATGNTMLLNIPHPQHPQSYLLPAPLGKSWCIAAAIRQRCADLRHSPTLSISWGNQPEHRNVNSLMRGCSSVICFLVQALQQNFSPDILRTPSPQDVNLKKDVSGSDLVYES
ncbi:hypothetical protein VNI00_015404 [Paramarasmius palmivorus]|uniref:Uncharacterized protein n=1 Tax=Paramarasmius palmivorus TaxID=297713 RepID=A0AAW0BIU4_9AGAR